MTCFDQKRVRKPSAMRCRASPPIACRASAVETIDVSGWPMIVHAEMDEDLAYALCEAIESRLAVMPTDNYKPLNMADLCSGGAETPLHAPLYPGAERYRERGYLGA